MHRIELIGADLANAPRRRDLLICLSHLRWRFVFQRPQHLMTRAAQHCNVIFWEEPVIGGAEPNLRKEAAAQGVTVITPSVPAGLSLSETETVQKHLLNEVVRQAEPFDRLIVWYYTPMAISFAADLNPDICIYDCMDELSAFLGAPPALLDREKSLMEQADLVFTGGRSLYESKRARHHNVHPFPSSIDRPHFAQARQLRGPGPSDQVDVPRPRIGFAGVIDERMDISLVEELARREPSWNFMMLGPVVKIDSGILPKAANIHWLGMKQYSELPTYFAGWDVSFMPFAMNAATRFISPTKTPEYLAAGIPVVSTPIRDVVDPYGTAGLVGIAEDAGDMQRLIRRALKRPRQEWLGDVDRFLSGMSWDRTFSEMWSLVQRTRHIEGCPATAAAPEIARHV